MRTIACVLLGVTLTAVAAGADWPQFRGPDGSGAAPDERVPIHWQQHLAWTASLPGRGVSSPVVVGDRLFVTACTGYRQDRLHVLCLDAATGRQRWHRQFWATGRTMTHPKTCTAAPTPASDGQRLFAFFSSNDLFCLTLDGDLLWLRGLTLDYPNASNSIGMASSPVVTDGTVVVQLDNDSQSLALGLDVTTGANRWKVDRPKVAAWSSPALVPDVASGRTAVVMQSQRGLAAYDTITGQQLWAYQRPCAGISSPVVWSGLVLVPSAGLVALRPAAGVGGARPEVKWRQGRLRPSTASPVVCDGRVYALNGAGVLACADADTGRLRWRLRLRGPFSATPVATASHLYCINEAGLAQVVSVAGPAGRIVAQYDFGERVLSTPAIAHGALYVRSDRHLWKIAGGQTAAHSSPTGRQPAEQ